MLTLPLSIDLPTLIWKAQAVYATRHRRTLRDHILGIPELLAKPQPEYLSRYSVPYLEGK
jgi:macrodomain Ter protein organizer (MatP/YcbG family)